MKLTIVNTLLLIGILSYMVIGGLTTSDNKNQAYVLTGELFAEFEYQNELEAEFIKTKELKENELNTLKNQLIALETKIRSGNASETEMAEYEKGVMIFKNREYQINQELAELNAAYSNKVWDKLNVFIKTYGEEKGYDVIFGASGEGNIMYANDDLNITDEIISYCNFKYSGK